VPVRTSVRWTRLFTSKWCGCDSTVGEGIRIIVDCLDSTFFKTVFQNEIVGLFVAM
jgi:hypothetical protein